MIRRSEQLVGFTLAGLVAWQAPAPVVFRPRSFATTGSPTYRHGRIRAAPNRTNLADSWLACRLLSIVSEATMEMWMTVTAQWFEPGSRDMRLRGLWIDAVERRVWLGGGPFGGLGSRVLFRDGRAVRLEKPAA